MYGKSWNHRCAAPCKSIHKLCELGPNCKKGVRRVRKGMMNGAYGIFIYSFGETGAKGTHIAPFIQGTHCLRQGGFSCLWTIGSIRKINDPSARPQTVVLMPSGLAGLAGMAGTAGAQTQTSRIPQVREEVCPKQTPSRSPSQGAVCYIMAAPKDPGHHGPCQSTMPHI